MVHRLPLQRHPARSSLVLRSVCIVAVAWWSPTLVPVFAEGPGPGFPDAEPVCGVLELDPSSGAASLGFRLGPGIGRPGLHYVPALVGCLAPKVVMEQAQDPVEGSGPRPALLKPRASGLSPGTLVWPLASDVLGEDPTGVGWTYPDGSCGKADGPCTQAVHPEEVLSRFGLAQSARPGSWPRPEHAAPVPGALAGTAGEVMIALRDEFPDPTRLEVGWTLPSGILVVRGDLAFAYRLSRAPHPSGMARYELVAILAPGGESVNFTYGWNGVDFEAAWAEAKVRVVAEDSGMETRLRVAYEGLAENPSFIITARMPPDASLAEGPSVPSSGAEPGNPGGAPGPCLSPSLLQVTQIQAGATGAAVRLVYGRAPSTRLVGAGGPADFAPSVLQSIVLPQRTLELEWEARSWSAGRDDAGGPGREAGWSYGVRAVRETGGPTYSRVTDGPSSDDPAGRARALAGPQAGWVRRSRHIAFAPTPRASGTCRTFIRDRWMLGEGGQGSCHGDGPRAGDEGIPTFEWDPWEQEMVPVAGVVTRWLEWEEELRLKAEELERQAQDLERQAEELRRQAEAAGF